MVLVSPFWYNSRIADEMRDGCGIWKKSSIPEKNA